MYIYIATGQEETTLGDIFFFYGSRKVLSLLSLSMVACFKNSLVVSEEKMFENVDIHTDDRGLKAQVS